MIMAEHVEFTTASPAAIWQLWSNVERWAEWDTDLEYVRLSGIFQKGAVGHLKPKGFFRLPFAITECKEKEYFIDQTNMYVARLVFTHTITKEGNGYRITHRAEARGLFGWFFAWMMGKGMRHDLPLSMKKLVAVAERHGK